MVREIRSAIASFHQDSEVKGVILTGIPHFFTAGLDVIELYSYNKEQITAFFADFGGMFIDLVTFKTISCRTHRTCSSGWLCDGDCLRLQSDG